MREIFTFQVNWRARFLKGFRDYLRIVNFKVLTAKASSSSCFPTKCMQYFSNKICFLECGLLDDFIDTLVEILTEIPYRYHHRVFELLELTKTVMSAWFINQKYTSSGSSFIT